MEKIIQWFPGHMAKAYRQIKEKIDLVDIVIEVIDSRAPHASLNVNLQEVIGNKPLLLVLNKTDLSDPVETKKWIKEYSKSYNVLALDSLNGSKNINEVSLKLDLILKEKIEKLKSIGKSIYPIRAMVIGIPNVGKSTLLNNLAKRRALEVGDRPGVTKNMQYLKANEKLLLLDNPGTLWPKFSSQDDAKLLALLGSIKDEILPIQSVCFYGIDKLKELYPNNLKERYKLNNLDLTSEELLIEIGKKRGCLIRGGEVDLDKVYDIFLRDLRSGKLGALTLERLN